MLIKHARQEDSDNRATSEARAGLLYETMRRRLLKFGLLQS